MAGGKNCEEREGGRHAMVKVSFTFACFSLARVSRAPYIFHAPATQATYLLASSINHSFGFEPSDPLSPPPPPPILHHAISCVEWNASDRVHLGTAFLKCEDNLLFFHINLCLCPLYFFHSTLMIVTKMPKIINQSGQVKDLPQNALVNAPTRAGKVFNLARLDWSSNGCYERMLPGDRIKPIVALNSLRFRRRQFKVFCIYICCLLFASKRLFQLAHLRRWQYFSRVGNMSCVR